MNDPNVLNDHNIVNSPMGVNGPNIVNSSNVLLFLTHNAYMFLTEFYCTKKKHSFSS